MYQIIFFFCTNLQGPFLIISIEILLYSGSSTILLQNWNNFDSFFVNVRQKQIKLEKFQKMLRQFETKSFRNFPNFI